MAASPRTLSHSLALTHTRTCVLSLRGAGTINLNNDIGLDAHSSYTIAEYLEDRERDDHRIVVERRGGTVVFDDGSVEYLAEIDLPLGDLKR